MLLHDDAVADIEPQTRAHTRGLRGVERIEDLLLSLDRNPWSAVGNLDDDPIVVLIRFNSSAPWPPIALIALSMRLVQTWLSSLP